MSNLRRRTVTTDDGVALHVVEAGDPEAPPLLLVHGFACSSQYWRHQLADPGLTDRFRVVAFDLRGHGSSQTDLGEAQILGGSMEENAALWARDVDAVREDLDGPVLVGWSFGGAVVESHIYAHGGIGDASAVVFLSAPCVLGPVPDGDPAAGIAGPEAIGALVATAKGQVEAFAGAVLARSPGDGSIDPGDRAMAIEIAGQCPPPVCSAMLAYAYDFRDFFAGLPQHERARMTALVTEDDQVFVAEGVHAVWKQAGVRTLGVPGEGHALFLRDPDRFRELLLDCVAGTPA